MNDTRRSNVSDRLFRSIGSLSIAQSQLRRISDDPDGFADPRSSTGWREFAEHLHTLAAGIMTSALAAHDRSTTLVAHDAGHRRLTLDASYVDQLSEKHRHHVRMAYLLGYEPPSADPTSTGSTAGPIAAYLPTLDATE